MNNKHLWWIIPTLIIISVFFSLYLFQWGVDTTMMELTKEVTYQLQDYKNKTYIICGYASECPSDHIARQLSGQCMECRPHSPFYNYTPFNMTEICRGVE